VTGGAGFIGANFIHDWLSDSAERVVNLDLLTYAGSEANLEGLAGDPRHVFVRGSIADSALVAALLREHQVRAIINFAAETHVDRAIEEPAVFFETNALGTVHLLDCARRYHASLAPAAAAAFRFIHVSTDEVFGSLAPEQAEFTETTPYHPNNPYSASKAASDHAARACFTTFNLPVIVTNCSNNYGPRQLPEKLIPLMISRALGGEPLPVYGSGLQIRDWLHVSDHCAALRSVLATGQPGESYNIGGEAPLTNLDVVHTLCRLLDQLRPRHDGRSYAQQIEHVRDRPGHDQRYGIDAAKITRELGWRPTRGFEAGLAATVEWYLANDAWLSAVVGPQHREWMARQYA